MFYVCLCVTAVLISIYCWVCKLSLQILIWRRACQTVILIGRNRGHFKMNTRVIGVNLDTAVVVVGLGEPNVQDRMVNGGAFRVNCRN